MKPSLNNKNYQLGVMIGEHIIARYLPTLAIDPLKSYHVIDVSDSDKAEHDRLESLWMNRRDDIEYDENDKSAWNNYRAFVVSLDKKYLPEKLICYIPIKINIKSDLSDLKHGIQDSLWDCDICTYSIESDKIVITNAPKGAWYYSIITLDLDTEE